MAPKIHANTIETNPSHKDQPGEIAINLMRSNSNSSDIQTDGPNISIKKRNKNENKWKVNVNKMLRNTGKTYEMNSNNKRIKNERSLKPPCTEICKIKCSTKFTEDDRLKIFKSYWDLGDLHKQRQYINNSMEPIKPEHRCERIGGTREKRSLNNAFYFHQNNEKIRVCKIFFKNTLDINDRPIRTVQEKREKIADVLLEDEKRGKHGKQRKIDPNLKEAVKNFIEKIPKLESHYTHDNTSRHVIDGSKSITDLHRDYVNGCKENNNNFVNYTMFYRVFTEEFNISFFTPKKDLCEKPMAFNNSAEQEINLKEYYVPHDTVHNLRSRVTYTSNNPANELTSNADVAILSSPLKEGKKRTKTLNSSTKKRKKNVNEWKVNVIKLLRNTGKKYEMNSNNKKIKNERSLKPPCTEMCKIKCSTKFTEDDRLKIFKSYWDLGDLHKQRQYINNSMKVTKPEYQCKRIGGTREKRSLNNAFYLPQNDEKIRVCKIFFKNTLDINDRPIRTVQEKRNMLADVLLEDEKRGKHGKQKKIDPNLKEAVKNFIESIPKIKNNYTHANTCRHVIDGSKSIADLHRDYVNGCKDNNNNFVNYTMFYRVFTEEFNISFFKPKKSLHENCMTFDNAAEEKLNLKEYSDQHDTIHMIAPNDDVTYNINPAYELTSSAEEAILISPLEKELWDYNMNEYDLN